MSAFSLGLIFFLFLKRIIEYYHPTFRYPIIKLDRPSLNLDTNYNYGQGVGILFRSDKF